MTVYRVMFCCNDERGVFTGRVTNVEIGDEISLVWPKDHGPSLRWFGSGKFMQVQIGRGRRMVCDRRDVCVGNVFWDATSMQLETARKIVRALLASGWAVEMHADDGPFADLMKGAAP